QMTLAAFLASFFGGLALAILFSQSKLVERSLLPYAIVLQVTPIVSIAPIIVIWVGLDHVERAVFILATIVAFFPILSNASLGLRSVDPGLSDLFRLYRASRWQRLFLLQLPSALPALLAGARISGGLALIGSVVAEFVAGSGEATGLAWRIAESRQRPGRASAASPLASRPRRRGALKTPRHCEERSDEAIQESEALNLG